MTDYSPLVERLRDASLVAFIGAGVSARYADSHSGRAWAGLSTASDLVQRFASRRSYIEPAASFSAACFLIKQREGRGGLERLLLEELDRPAIAPLPAHVLLANLPFSCFVTTNYDKLLERALFEAKRKPHELIDDDDVSRLRSSHVPVVKLHGCISRPDTIIAAEDEYLPIEERHPILAAYVKTQLANKTVLFLGFGLADPNFRALFEQLKRSLGDRMPRSYAVVLEADAFQSEFWGSKGVNVVTSDLLEFLRGLLRTSAEESPNAVYHPGEDWITNAFFESLHRIRTLPSETQVIDAFLEHFLEEVRSPNLELEDILVRATQAAGVVLARRPNFHALGRVAGEVVENVRSGSTTKEDAEVVVEGVLNERQVLARGFREKGRSVVERGDSLLVFSQSVRVLQLLTGVPRGTQDTCQIYVAECRPKSPFAFQDALAVCESLLETGYEVTIVPDAAIGNLIARSQVRKVLMGAHGVFRRGERFHSFVNTCGARLILSAAKEARVPVYVVAETFKIEALSRRGTPMVSFAEEEDLFVPVNSAISDLKAHGLRLSVLNIGYDLCPFTPNVELVTEK